MTIGVLREGGFGGGCRNRTDVDGFAIRCITTLLTRRGAGQSDELTGLNDSGKVCTFPDVFLEREKSLELSTSTLARLRSTN